MASFSNEGCLDRKAREPIEMSSLQGWYVSLESFWLERNARSGCLRRRWSKFGLMLSDFGGG